MRFPYLRLRTSRPIPSLGGARDRYRPIVPVRLFGPLGSHLRDGSLDSGSDDTVFPRSVAPRLGIDLTGAPPGEARPAGGLPVPFVYAAVILRLTDGRETCEWEATVGFADIPMRWALLGHAGFLEFFDVELRGAGHEAILTPNRSFPGQHTVQQPPSP